jgi:hypothetical protein
MGALNLAFGFLKDDANAVGVRFATIVAISRIRIL